MRKNNVLELTLLYETNISINCVSFVRCQILRPTFPGMMRYIAKNIFNLVTLSRYLIFVVLLSGRRGGLMVSALVSGSSGSGSSPGRGHCVVFLGKTLYSHSASLHPGV